jgi:prepilin-type N-terminal cleavage/methylation domain-containing protein
MKNKILGGFTLAEVLITLGIIGVIAALVIPALMQNSQKQQYVTAYQKGLSTLSQALTEVSEEYGCVGDLACTGLFDAAGGVSQIESERLVTALTNSLKIVNNCGGTGTDCFPKTVKYLNNAGSETLGAETATFAMADGFSYAVRNLGLNCTAGCITAYFDANGFKPPNKYGRDVFLFYVNRSGKIIPHGSTAADWQSPSDNNVWQNCRLDLASNGLGCSARIIQQGWQMNY